MYIQNIVLPYTGATSLRETPKGVNQQEHNHNIGECRAKEWLQIYMWPKTNQTSNLWNKGIQLQQFLKNSNKYN